MQADRQRRKQDASVFTPALTERYRLKGVKFMNGHHAVRLNKLEIAIESVAVSANDVCAKGQKCAQKKAFIKTDAFVMACGSYIAPCCARWASIC